MRVVTDSWPGYSLLELLAVLTVGALGLTIGMPALGNLHRSARMTAGARHLAVTLHALRWKSVTEGRGHGLLFRRDEEGWLWYLVRDGNGNGLSSAEVTAGRDPVLSGPHRLEHQVPGVTFGFPPVDSVPQIPPRPGTLGSLVDPIRIGNTKVLAFSPLGTATSGTLYLTDGQRGLVGIVLFGPTTRIRVWRYDVGGEQWTLL